MPGINSIICPILLKGLTMLNCRPCSTPFHHKSTSKSIASHRHKTTFSS
ncbi:unnamed protein product, partial [Vitis vinifera]|uniref:Uncharacterized protein n=1 Tax=Vitis vinifera TaxID=29760 RepID=D7SRX2_VITVI